MFPVAISLFMLGLLLYAAGRRGWLMGSHPYCRACGFDLFRLPAERRRCPECGADILVDDAIEVGRRRPMRSVIGAGLGLIVTGLALSAMAFVPWWTHFDGAPFKPNAWLQSDVLTSDEFVRQRATVELLRRIRAGQVTPMEANRLADILLARQGNPAISWRRSWGDLIQAARISGKISPERWEQYLRQAMQVTARVRPRVGSDEPVPVAISCRLRAGSDWQAIAPAVLQPQVEITLGKIHAPLRIGAVQIASVPAPLEWSALWIPDESDRAEVMHSAAPLLEGRITMMLKDRTGITASLTQDFSGPLEILPPKKSSVELRVDAAMRSDVDQSVVVRLPGDGGVAGKGGGGRGGQVRITRSGANRIGSVWVSGPPMTLAFRVMLRQGDGAGREWMLARLMIQPNDAANVPLVLNLSALDEPPISGPAEIIFVPDASMAGGTVDVLEIWGEPLTRKVILAVDQY